MTNLLNLLKNINTLEDSDLKHTLEKMISISGVEQIEDANWYYSQQQKVVLAESGIKNLEPLRYLNKVEYLVLFGNSISDISPLFDLPNLHHLNLIGNDISSLEGIDKLQSLTELYLGDNLVKDISPLASLSNLRYLGLRNNKRVVDLTPLTKLVQLQQVNLAGTSVKEVDINRLIGLLPVCKILT